MKFTGNRVVFCPLSANSAGWFLPSLDELLLILAGILMALLIPAHHDGRFPFHRGEPVTSRQIIILIGDERTQVPL